MTYLKHKRSPLGLAAVLALGLPLSLPVHAAVYDWNNASGDSTMEGVNWFDTAAPATDTAITSSSHQINFRGHTSGDIIATFNNSVGAFTSGGSGNIYYVRPEQTDDVSIRNVAGSAQVLRILARSDFAGGQVIGLLGTDPGNFTFGGAGSDPITMVLGAGAGTKFARITNEATNGSTLTFGSNVNFQVGGGTGAELRFEGAGDIDFLGSLIGGQTGTMVRNITTQNTGTVLLGGDNATNDNVSIGTVTINNGTLAVGHNNALGAGTVSIANGARLTADASARTINNTITNTNGAILGQDGAGRLTLAGDWITSDARLLTVQGEVEVTGLLANSATGTNARDLTGGGTLIISSAQNQLDNNRIFLSHGTLRAAHDNAVGAAGQLSVDVRNLAGATNGQSTLELSNNVSINLAEGVRVAGRDLSGPQWTQLRNVDGDNTLGAVILQAGGTDYGIESQAGSLTINGFGGETGDRDLYVSGAGDVSVPGWNDRRDITMNGSGTLTIEGNSTHTGPTTINSGTVVARTDIGQNALSNTAVVNNGTLRFELLPGTAWAPGDQNLRQVNNPISGSGDVVIETGDFAAVRFNAANTYSGTTTVNNDSRLSITGDGTFGDGTGDVVLDGGLLGIYRDMTVTNVITGTTGDVTLHSNSTVLFNAENTFSNTIGVTSGSAIGGSGSFAGNLTVDAGGLLVFNPLTTLDIFGSVALDNSFGVDSLIGSDGSAIDWSVIGEGTYTIIGTTLSDFSNIQNFGSANAYDLGGGKSAYFQNGSLQLVVVPEPGAYALIGGFLALSWVMVRRRKVKA